MLFGPIPWRECRVLSRRGETFSTRAALLGLALVMLASVKVGWSWAGWERTSIGGMTKFTLTAFACLVCLQALLTWLIVPTDVAPAIASERERKTLDALLASGLSSAQIVVGTILARLARHLSGLAAVVPVMLLMIPLGGLDPRLVALGCAGLLSTTLALAVIAAASSTFAPSRNGALGWALIFSVGWMFMPMLLVLLVPKIWPAGPRWIVPGLLPVLESSPLGVAANLLGLVRRCGPVESILRMIGLQLAVSAVLLLWTIVRFRSACATVHDAGERSLGLLRARRGRRATWPPCGEFPIFWRARYSKPIVSGLAHAVSGVIALGVVSFMVVGTYWFAEPAFRELFARGYGGSATQGEAQQVSPIILAIVRGWSGGPPPGTAREEFNVVLRQSTLFWLMFHSLAVMAQAASSIAKERTQDTLSGLLATPLTGWEILREKMLASTWRGCPPAVMVVVPWMIGLLAGAVHPVGFLAAALVTAISTWFWVALGTYFSLLAPDSDQATSRTLACGAFLIFGPIMFTALAPGWGSVVLGAGSLPLTADIALVSHDDVAIALRRGTFPHLGALGIRTGEGALAVAATIALALLGQGLGAWFLTRAAVRRFDAAVGRPVRSKAIASASARGPGLAFGSRREVVADA